MALEDRINPQAQEQHRGGRESHPELPSSVTPLAADAIEHASHFVYLVTCADHTLYTGYTTNIERRLAAHNAGVGAKYTRGRRPVTLVASWPFASKGEALRAERAIKSLPREQKLRLARAAGLQSNNKDSTLINAPSSPEVLRQGGTNHT